MSKMEIVPELRDEYVSKDGHRLLKKDIMRMIRRKKIFVEDSKGVMKVTSRDLDILFTLLWVHVEERINVANLMNSADQGPGGFVRYLLHSRAADLMNNGKWDDLIKFENDFDAFYPESDCPFRVHKRTPDKHIVKVRDK